MGVSPACSVGGSLLRAGTLGGLVVAAPGLFVGCGDDGSPPPKDAADGIRLVSSDVARTTVAPAAIGTGAGTVLALGAGLYGQLIGTPGNLAVSPYSAAVALGMTVNGAVGATRDEMLEVLAASDTASLDDGLNGAHGVRRVAGRPGPGREGRRDRARLGQPAVRPGRLRVAGAVPRRPGPELRRRAPRGRLRRSHREGAGCDQRLDRRSRPTTGSPRSSPGARSTRTRGWCWSTRCTSRRRGRRRSRSTPRPTSEFHLGDGSTASPCRRCTGRPATERGTAGAPPTSPTPVAPWP